MNISGFNFNIVSSVLKQIKYYLKLNAKTNKYINKKIRSHVSKNSRKYKNIKIRAATHYCKNLYQPRG